MLFFDQGRCKPDNCAEQAFFTTVIAIALAACCVAIFFDLVLIPRDDNQVRLASLFVQLTLLSLFAVRRINFNHLTSCTLAIMAVLFTYRGLFVPGFEDVTKMILITIGFLAAIVTRGPVNLILKAGVFVCLLVVLPQNADASSVLVAVRLALPYVAMYMIITICSGMLKSRYEQNQARLNSMVELLNKKNAKISMQQQMLQQSIWKLTSVNGDLETLVDEKTRRIAEKNRQLSDVAYLNAHQVRAPLARILGLLQLMDYEPANTEAYMAMLRDQAREMDEKLRMVTKSIESNMHDFP